MHCMLFTLVFPFSFFSLSKLLLKEYFLSVDNILKQFTFKIKKSPHEFIFAKRSLPSLEINEEN